MTYNIKGVFDIRAVGGANIRGRAGEGIRESCEREGMNRTAKPIMGLRGGSR